MENSEEKRVNLRLPKRNGKIQLVPYPPTKSEVIKLIQKTAIGFGGLGLFSFLIRVIVFLILGRSFR